MLLKTVRYFQPFVADNSLTQAKLSMSPLQIKNQVIMRLDKVRDLGVIVDNKLTMESHSANVASSLSLIHI